MYPYLYPFCYFYINIEAMKTTLERTKGTPRFSFKSKNRAQKNKNTAFTIYLFFTYGGNRLKLSTGIKVKFVDWDFNKQRIRHKAHLTDKDTNNLKLSKIEKAIQEVFNESSLETTNVTPNYLKNRLKIKLNGDKANSVRVKLTFSELIDKYIELKKGRIQKVTLRLYKQAALHVKDYEKNKGKKLELEDINTSFYKAFVNFLETEKEFALNTIGKHIKSIKTFMNFALTEGYTNNQAFKSSDFKVIKEITTEIYLNEDEIEAFYNIDLSKHPNLSHARDLFLIGYYTGQRVSDYNSFKKEDIQTIKGQDYFVITQQKNKKRGRKVYCPITKEIREIMNLRHNGLPPKRIPHKDINDYIKQVGQKLNLKSLNEKVKCEFTKAGIQQTEYAPKYKLIKSHTARRSFATNMYKKGMPVYDIMLFTGHTTEKEFYKYIRIKDEERITHVLGSGFFNV